MVGSPLTAVGKKKLKGHQCVQLANFSNNHQFSSALRACVSALVSIEDRRPKLLVISAHGVAVTGTELQASNDEAISLWDFPDHFAALPTSIVVFLSACFGAYPSAAAIQQRSQLFVLGPVVDIAPCDANAFQKHLLDVLEVELSCRSLFRLVHGYNKALSKSYDNRFVFGFYDQAGHFFPRRALGSQLAAKVELPMNFEVTSLIPALCGVGTQRCQLKADDGALFHTGIAPLLPFANKPKELVGMLFRSRYQVMQHHADYPKVIYLLNVKKRRLGLGHS